MTGPGKHLQGHLLTIMTRCATCDSYYPNPRCPCCQPRIEEEEIETEEEEEPTEPTKP